MAHFIAFIVSLFVLAGLAYLVLTIMSTFSALKTELAAAQAKLLRHEVSLVELNKPNIKLDAAVSSVTHATSRIDALETVYDNLATAVDAQRADMLNVLTRLNAPIKTAPATKASRVRKPVYKSKSKSKSKR